jgi:hypothetical protein
MDLIMAAGTVTLNDKYLPTAKWSKLRTSFIKYELLENKFLWMFCKRLCLFITLYELASEWLFCKVTGHDWTEVC